jgi:glycerol kinase
MNKDSSKGKLEKVYVDGGMTENAFLLQLLANILGIPVGRFLMWVGLLGG